MWIERGASQVIVTSAVFKDGRIDFSELERLTDAVSPEQLVLDLSCRKKDGEYCVVTDRWTKFTDSKLSKELLERFSGCCCEYLIHAVDVEGKCSGIDTDLVKLLADNSPIACVYAGGIKDMQDIEAIERYGAGRIAYTIGSALDIFGGKLSYREIVEHARRNS
jgi:phosphoribosylformimino-5-aminoimidazole carboxamide ribotide isomerase